MTALGLLALGLPAVTACGGGGGGNGDPDTAVETDAPTEAPSMAPFLDGAALPAALSELGLYPVAGDLETVAAEAVVYAPVWPLWSNGFAKHRYVAVPPGTAIDTADDEAWVVPVGTLMFKTFTGEDASFPGGHRPLETRVLRKTEDNVEYAVYLWDADGLDATLLDMKAPLPVEAPDGAGGTFEHVIPSKLQCRKCHESHPQRVLGIRARQLVDAAADEPEAELAALVEAGVLARAEDAAPAPAVDHDDPLTRDVLGYLLSNCVHCHNGSDGPSSSYDLAPAVALEVLIDQPTEHIASADGIRVVPGDPEASVLWQAMTGEDNAAEAKPMPPVGVQVVDQDGLELVAAWILSLAEEP